MAYIDIFILKMILIIQERQAPPTQGEGFGEGHFRRIHALQCKLY
jgi:hypothetical protein